MFPALSLMRLTFSPTPVAIVKRSRKLNPLAAGYSSSVDKEMTIISGRTHKDNLADFYPLLLDAVLAPALRLMLFIQSASNTASAKSRAWYWTNGVNR